MADAFGLQSSVERSRARRIREAGFLSQEGHGRGAAEAIPKDATMILLVSAVGSAPLHAGKMAAAFDECISKDGKSVVDEVAELIDIGADTHSVTVNPTGKLCVGIRDNGTGKTRDFETPDESEIWEALRPTYGIGGPTPLPGFQRYVEIPGWMLQNVGQWLRGDE